MSAERPGPLQSVPTLTEVVSLPDTERADAAASAPAASPGADPAPPPLPQATPSTRDGPEVAESPAAADAASELSAAAEAAPGETQLTRQVLEELQRQIDGVLEFRVREVLAPILARATDAIVREARSELTRSVRELVAQLVAQELHRQRGR